MNKITLVQGKGNGTTTACVVSFAAKQAGYLFDDDFPCLCPLVRALTLPLNDDSQWWVDDAERTRKLMPLSRLLPGTKSTRAVEIKRAHLCALWAVRVFAASALGSAGFLEEAARLRALPDHSSLVDLSFHAANAAAAAAANAAANAAVAANAANAAAAAAHAAHAAHAVHAAHAAANTAHAAARAAHAAANTAEQKILRRQLKNLILAVIAIKE